MPEMREVYEATAESVGRARHAVRAFVEQRGAHEHVTSAIALAVSEACTNVVVHAYRESSSPGEIIVSATELDNEFEVQVADRGMGMTPRIDSPGIGMGLPLISRLASVVETRASEAGGTEICMRFSRSGGDRMVA
jgi:serine/threonine-protein kinase RsbW